jgi:FkbM family methyltransferase
VAALSGSRALGRRARMRARALYARELALGPPRRARLRVGPALLELGGDRHDFAVDWKTLVEVFGEESYATAYAGARVLDVGAHEGYFGAYALARGASVVLSCEPAAANYAVLQRTAQPFGSRWLTRNLALGARRGPGTLLLDETSWAHSLRQVDRPAGTQPVSIVTLGDALAELPRRGSPTIVKVDAEGSECEILSHAEALVHVDVLFVEWHPKASDCTADELRRRAESGGLRLATHAAGVFRFER